LKIGQASPGSSFDDVSAQETTRAARRFDTSGITATIQRALASAGLNTESGPMKGVTDTIQQALTAAGLSQRLATPSGHAATIQGSCREIDAPSSDIDITPAEPPPDSEEPVPGEFLLRSFANQAGTRTYKLYVPASYSIAASETVPIVVMLHGCTQSPDDFAAGTRMNALADRHGFLVIYPTQAARANGSRCWNWFRPEDQTRDSGEPSLIAGITREVAGTHRVDERRIFVAGMSAGAAMAVILGATYPELYAAVGAHSGLPHGAAHDMPSALAAMHGGAALPGLVKPSTATPANRTPGWTPTIVFHGDQDRTVDPRNGTAIVEQVTVIDSARERLHGSVRTGTAPGGRRYTLTEYVDNANQPVVEHWIVHGAGHAWSGGSPDGSFTDATGPDASAEMIRFFSLQRPAGTS
jgi:poly(hydroxyalkanoate) depolymerase family esterase